MKRSMRRLAALLLIVLLPLQGYAAAFAPAVHHAPDAAQHCHDGEGGDGHENAPAGDEGKCCHAQAFLSKPPQVSTALVPAAVRPTHYVARWTSFIPEEPSPPPIASAA